MTERCDVVIIGGGAAGLMCARVAGRRGRSVLILDHAKRPAEKIRISGGGRCNFTNMHSSPVAFLSNNQHFCKSVFNRYTQDDFVQLVTKHQIAFHEKNSASCSVMTAPSRSSTCCSQNVGTRRLNCGSIPVSVPSASAHWAITCRRAVGMSPAVRWLLQQVGCRFQK